MVPNKESFASFVLQQRERYRRRLYSACLLLTLIAILLYQTRWLSLRFGLIILLAGQIADLLSLLSRVIQLSNDSPPTAAWFAREESFVRRLALLGTTYQSLGFLALGYAFWTSTRSLWISLAIGVVYPLTLYFGLTRGRSSKAIKQLRAKKDELLSNG